MSHDENSEDQPDMEVPFPTDEELLAAGYVPIDFTNMPDVSDLVTALGHPFPTHDEIVQAGYVPISRRERRIQSRPRIGQMYWVDFPHDAYAPEFVNEHPGIVIRAANSLHDTCIILPVTSAQQKAGTHFHELLKNPNPKGHAEGRIAYVVCDHFYTVNINRLRPVLSLKGDPIFPKIDPHDLAAIFAIVQNVLNTVFASAQVAIATAQAAQAVAPSKPPGPNTLSLRKK